MIALPTRNVDDCEDRADEAAPESGRRVPDDRGERCVHEPEGREAGERDDVGDDADDGVEDLDRRLRDRARAATRLDVEARAEQDDASDGENAAEDADRDRVPVPAGGGEAHPEEDQEPRDPRGGEEGRHASPFAPAVDDPDQVAQGEEDTSDRDPGGQESHRILRRLQPQRGHDSGRAEELPVQQAEEGRGETRSDGEGPEALELGEPTPACTREGDPQRGEQQPLPNVAEHHPEHDDEGGRGERRRVDVRVPEGSVARPRGGGTAEPRARRAGVSAARPTPAAGARRDRLPPRRAVRSAARPPPGAPSPREPRSVRGGSPPRPGA